MKNMNKYIAAVLITAGLSGAAYAVQAKESGVNDALAAASARVTIKSAIDQALNKVPGTVVAVEYENEDGKAVWEVEVLAANKSVHDLTIDASSGKVLSNQVDSNDDGDDEDKDD